MPPSFFFLFLKCDFLHLLENGYICITTSHSKSERLVLNTTVCTLGSKIVHKAKVQNNFGAKGHGLQPPPKYYDALDPPLFNVNQL